MEGEGGVNDDRQVIEAVAQWLSGRFGYGWGSDPTIPKARYRNAARDLLAMVRGVGWQPAPTVADPRRTEAEVKAEALEEAADSVRRSDWYMSWKVDNYAGAIQHWLRARAAQLREGQQ